MRIEGTLGTVRLVMTPEEARVVAHVIRSYDKVPVELSGFDVAKGLDTMAREQARVFPPVVSWGGEDEA